MPHEPLRKQKGRLSCPTAGPQLKVTSMSKYDSKSRAEKQGNLPYQIGLALKLAERGFRVFPLKPGAKTPARKGWQNEAASDPDTVKALFADKPDSNIGIAMGGGLFAFDCDRKDGKDGDAALRALLGVDAIWLDLTFAVATPSGGLHYVFRCPADKTIRNSAGKIAPGVDVRGEGGYLATVGSVIDGKRYTVANNAAPIDAPESILAIIAEAATPAEPRPSPAGVELDTPATVERARAYLAETEPAIEGQGGNDRTYATAAAIMDMGVSEEMNFLLMSEVFNPRCIPPFPEDELEKIVRNAATYRQNEPGCDDPAAHFDIVTDWTPPAPANDNAVPGAEGSADARRLLESGTLDLAALTGEPIPPREWLVEGWVPDSTVTLLYGDGGTGKSLAVMQLAVAVATGRPWFGLPATAGPALYLTAEDDETELHRRIADIAAERGLTLADLAGGLTAISLAAADPALAVAGERDRIKFTPLWKALKAMIAEVKPRLVVLDTLADIFAGNENIRAQARAFIGALRAIAIENRTAIVVLAHPSRAGLMAQGHNAAAGSSGSTAWHNSVRSRLLLERDDRNADLRVLKIVKANYGRTGAELRLRWHDGAFVAEGGPDADAAEAAEAEHVFLEMLDGYTTEGRSVGPNEGKNYAPSVFSKDARSRAFDSKALAAAMNRLFAAGAIRVVEVGPPSKRRAMIIRSEPTAEAA
jgi:RecA-family ATPase